MKRKQLDDILLAHMLWSTDKGGKQAYLRNADLRNADLRNADLRNADLKSANLKTANLEGANLDFSCLPLWCGGLDFKIDDRAKQQLLYHVINLCGTKHIKKSGIKFANESHVVTKHGQPMMRR